MSAERPGPANTWIWLPLSTTWTDYGGDEVYGDYEVAAGSSTTYTELRSFEPGLGRVSPWASSGSQAEYYHGDLIGTTRAVSDRLGGELSSAVYSAFGEPISGPVVGDVNRYNYAGAWGYQEHGEFLFVHVGLRYCDPSTGRFLQRDPIGIMGGLNVYGYVASVPTTAVDPDGLQRIPVKGVDVPPDYRGRLRWPIRGTRPPVPPPSWWTWWTTPARFTPGVVGACAVAFAVGYGAGTGIDYAVAKATGKKLSERIGDWMYRTCPGCFDWTVSASEQIDEEYRPVECPDEPPRTKRLAMGRLEQAIISLAPL